MINHETELKLQAYLDSELSAGEAKAIADLLGRDAGAQALYQELRIAKVAFGRERIGTELPDSREFYWSKIRRQIERRNRCRRTDERTILVSLVAPVPGPGGCAGWAGDLCGGRSPKPGRWRELSGLG